jgi:hypothetical protein
MNRRQALQVLLLAPAGFEPQGNTTAAATWTYPYRLIMQLADKQGDGINEIEVSYNGKSLNFSAKQIWEALNEPTIGILK